MRLVLAIAAACSTPPTSPPRRVPAPVPAPMTRLQSKVDVIVYVSLEGGVPDRMFVRLEVAYDRAAGMYVRIATYSGDVEVVCDGARAWTLRSKCSTESSCDEAVRHWFDIGWGYAELARFVAGEAVPTPGWRVFQRRGVRGNPIPTSATIGPDGKDFPGAAVGWETWIPDRVDLDPIFARARAMPACP